jgi:hypothetical protein
MVTVPDPTSVIIGPVHVKSMLPSEAFSLPSIRPVPAASATASPQEGCYPSGPEPFTVLSQMALFWAIVNATRTWRRSS